MPTVDGLTVKYDSMYAIELVRVNSAVVVPANDCSVSLRAGGLLSWPAVSGNMAAIY